MKTTIELPNELMKQAKAVAAKRKTTMKAMIEHALRREILFEEDQKDDPAEQVWETNEFGFPVLKTQYCRPITSEDVQVLLDEDSES